MQSSTNDFSYFNIGGTPLLNLNLDPKKFSNCAQIRMMEAFLNSTVSHREYTGGENRRQIRHAISERSNRLSIWGLRLRHYSSGKSIATGRAILMPTTTAKGRATFLRKLQRGFHGCRDFMGKVFITIIENGRQAKLYSRAH